MNNIVYLIVLCIVIIILIKFYKIIVPSNTYIKKSLIKINR